MSNLRGDAAKSLLEATKISEEVSEARFRFSPELEVFAGHFPGHPLLPGVLQVEMIRTALERLLDRTLTISRLNKAKFVREIRPGELILLTLKPLKTEKGLAVRAEAKVGDEKASQISLLLG